MAFSHRLDLHHLVGLYQFLSGWGPPETKVSVPLG